MVIFLPPFPSEALVLAQNTTACHVAVASGSVEMGLALPEAYCIAVSCMPPRILSCLSLAVEPNYVTSSPLTVTLVFTTGIYIAERGLVQKEE
jgi:hypothetical protein